MAAGGQGLALVHMVGVVAHHGQNLVPLLETEFQRAETFPELPSASHSSHLLPLRHGLPMKQIAAAAYYRYGSRKAAGIRTSSDLNQGLDEVFSQYVVKDHTSDTSLTATG